jgi:cytochrome c
MMSRVGWGLAVGALALVIVARPTIAAAGDDPAAGQALFKGKCAACHTVDANRVGPKLQGVVGRPVASAAGYTYSPALKKLGGVWTSARIDQFLSGPQKMAPGSKMYLQVGDPKHRQQIGAYLQSISTKK